MTKSVEETRARLQSNLRNKEAENNRLTVQLRVRVLFISPNHHKESALWMFKTILNVCWLVVFSRLLRELVQNRSWRLTVWKHPSPLWLRRQHGTKNLLRKELEHTNWELRGLKLPLTSAMHSWRKRYEVKMAQITGFQLLFTPWRIRILLWHTGCSDGQSPFRE